MRVPFSQALGLYAVAAIVAAIGDAPQADLAHFVLKMWRRRRESNPCTRFCRPLPEPLGHVATGHLDWLPREDSNLG